MRGNVDRNCRGQISALPALATLLAFAALVAAVVAVPAAADHSTRFFEHERCVYRRGGPPGPKGNSLLVVSYEPVGFVRHGDEIRVYTEGVRCEGPDPTIKNIDEIVVQGAETEGGMDVDERGGRFGPGASGSGIKFRDHGPRVTVDGTNGRDHIAVANSDGRTAIDLDASAPRPREDVLMLEGAPELITIDGRQGDDLLDARRLKAFGDRRHRLKLFGGDGDDTVLGSPGNDFMLSDGPGDDLIRGGGGNDIIRFVQGRDTLIGGSGNDELSYSNYSGPVGRLLPDPPDRLFGGPGRDLLEDLNHHSDLLDCGPGFDLVTHERRDQPDANCERKWY